MSVERDTRRAPRWTIGSAVSFLLLLPRPAAADLPARLITRARAADVYADSTGRVPLLVGVSDTVDAETRGLWSVAPGLAAVRVAPAAINPLLDANADLDFVVAPSLHLHLDRARAWSNVGTSRFGAGLTGEGVVVGILDAGFDLAHPALRDAEGGTRVAWLMTPSLPAGIHPELESEYGCTMPGQASCAIYAKEDIDELLSSSRPLPLELGDITGHGTHVASTAAGNGGASLSDPPTYVGVAPNATLVLGVISPELYADEVLRLTRFVYDRAEEVGAPAVVNLSAGTHAGPHDGSDALSTGLAALTEVPSGGRAFVASAGNDAAISMWGDQPLGIHRELEVRSGACARIQTLTEGGGVEVWVSLESFDDLRVGLRGPEGEPWLSPARPGETLSYEDAVITATVAHIAPAVPSRLTHAVLSWHGHWSDGASMEIEFVGNGYAHLWVHDIVFGAVARFPEPSSQTTIGIPATHPSLIAVGSSVNRQAWPAAEGMVTPWDQAEDDTSVWSSMGPTVGGLLKPDLLAPGEYVVAAMSSMADPRDPFGASIFLSTSCSPSSSSCMVVDDLFAAARGTSMAAPVVAGAAALLFEVAPDLTASDMRRLLTTSARRGGAGPDPQRGFGALDLEAALSLLTQPNADGAEVDPGRSWWTLSSDRLPPASSRPLIGVIQLRDESGRRTLGDPAAIEVVVDGAELVEPPAPLADQTLSFAIRRSAPDVEAATIEVRYADVRVGEARTLEAAPIGAACPPLPLSVGGGCGCSMPTRSPPRPALVLCLAASLALLRRRPRARLAVQSSSQRIPARRAAVDVLGQ